MKSAHIVIFTILGFIAACGWGAIISMEGKECWGNNSRVPVIAMSLKDESLGLDMKKHVYKLIEFYGPSIMIPNHGKDKDTFPKTFRCREAAFKMTYTDDDGNTEDNVWVTDPETVNIMAANIFEKVKNSVKVFITGWE